MSRTLTRRRLLAAGLSAAGAGIVGLRLRERPSNRPPSGPSATAAAPAQPSAPDSPAAPSRIVLENQQAGTRDWQLAQWDKEIPFGVYLDHGSICAGQGLQVFASAREPAACSLEVFRLGYYSGLGACRMLIQENVQVPAQGWWVPTRDPVQGWWTPTRDRVHDGPSVAYDPATGLLDCRWQPVASITPGPDWVPGYYLIRLTDSTGLHCMSKFVLRDDARPGALLAMFPSFTHQAYNAWGGKSLYDYNTPNVEMLFGHTRAVKVSFNRPFARTSGLTECFNCEPQFVYWAEQMGYDVSYCTDADLHQNPDLAQKTRALLVIGHAEYWTHQMLSHTISARNIGKHLAFLGGNDVYWQIRTEPDAAGHADRTVVCYKNAADDPRSGDPEAATVRFVDPAVALPQSVLTGTVYGSELAPFTQDWIVAGDHWLLTGTGLRRGDHIKGLVGREYDRLGQPQFTPPGIETIGASPVTDAHGGRGTAGSSLYRWPSGALVFSAGTIYWTRALANNSPNYDWRVGRITSNLLDRFLDSEDPAD
jgi:N,N-dimethylformamidase beta subunit-like, C-terminal